MKLRDLRKSHAKNPRKYSRSIETSVLQPAIHDTHIILAAASYNVIMNELETERHFHIKACLHDSYLHPIINLHQ